MQWNLMAKNIVGSVGLNNTEEPVWSTQGQCDQQTKPTTTLNDSVSARRRSIKYEEQTLKKFSDDPC